MINATFEMQEHITRNFNHMTIDWVNLTSQMEGQQVHDLVQNCFHIGCDKRQPKVIAFQILH